MVIRTIPEVANTAGKGAIVPDGSERMLLDRTGTPLDSRLDQIIALTAAASGSTVSYGIRAFGARGDGISDDTIPLRDAVESGGNVIFEPGTYLTDTIDAPDTGFSFVGLHHGDTKIRGLPGRDVIGFKTALDLGDPFASPQPGSFLRGIGLEVDVGNLSNLKNDFDRCTADGYGIGPCALVGERSNFSAGNVDPGFGLSRILSALSVTDCSLAVVGIGDQSQAGGLHFQGPVTDLSVWNLLARRCGSALTSGPSFVRRVTVNPGSDDITVVNAVNPFVNGHRVRLVTHEAGGGVQPAGVAKDTIFTVANVAGTNLELTGQTFSDTGAETYLVVVENGAGDQRNEGWYVGDIKHYNSVYSIGVHNPIGCTFVQPKSYKAKTALSCPNYPSSSTQAGHSLTASGVCAFQTELSPALATDPLIRIDPDHVSITGLNYRGSSSGRTRCLIAGNDATVLGLVGRAPTAGEIGNEPIFEFSGLNGFFMGYLADRVGNDQLVIANPNSVGGNVAEIGSETRLLNDLGSRS